MTMTKKAKLGLLMMGLALLIGAASVQPSVGLYWTSNSDPTVSPGVSAPAWQLLLRTDAPSIYYKSGAAATAWTAVGGAAAPSRIFSATQSGAVPASGGGTTKFLNADGMWTNPTATYGFGVFGTGADGSCHFDGTSTPVCGGILVSSNYYQLHRDIYMNNGIIDPGVVVDPNGYRIFDKGNITGTGGQISYVAESGGDAIAGGQGPAGQGRGDGVLKGDFGGGAGGSQGGGNGVASGNQIQMPRPCGNAPQVTCTGVPAQCQGGAGGKNNAGTCGGNGGSIATLSDTNGPQFYGLTEALTLRSTGSTGTPPISFGQVNGGGGGQGSTGAGCGGGGGGGAGGGSIVIVAHSITGLTVHADGGNGGRGQQSGCSGSCAGGATQCNGGGGGGGAGGYVVEIIGSGSFPTTTVNGGIGGAKSSGCVSCSDGVNGGSGVYVPLEFGL